MTLERRALTTRDNAEISTVDAADFRVPRQVTPAAIQEHFAIVACGTDPELMDAKAGITWRALRYRWPRYQAWCEATDRAPLPCSAEQLREFVRHCMGERLAPSSIAAAVSAVCTIARIRGSHADRRLISEYMRAARRRHGPPKRAPPVRGADVAELLGLLDPAVLRDARDALVVVLGFGLAARAAELVGLDLERAGSVALGSIGIVQLEASGILVRWHRSKTAQHRDVELEIADAEMPEARAWLERWIDLAEIRPASPLLRPLTRWGTVVNARLSTAAISAIIRARVEQLEIARGRKPYDARQRASRFSSHSLRRGFCTSAADAGVPLSVIRKRSRHADDGMVARYVGESEARRVSGLAGLVTSRKGEP